MLSRSWTFLRAGGLSFVIFTKNKEGVRAIQAMKYKKYVATDNAIKSKYTGLWSHAAERFCAKEVYLSWYSQKNKEGVRAI